MTAEIAQVRSAALPLEHASDLDPLIDRAKHARLVLIGEASHGTHDYYDLRSTVTKRLIAECGFSAVAIEADQPNCDAIDQCVRLADDATDNPEDVLREQRHWPSWMLANTETVDFCTWLRAHNQNRVPEDRAYLQGLDVYPLWAATRGVLRYLSQQRGWSADRVNGALDAPLRGEPMVPPELMGAVATHLAASIPARSPAYDAQRYYQDLLNGGAKAMKARTILWLGTLDLLLRQRDEQGRAVIWAHNTHVGDARGTDSSSATIGQLAREHYGDDNVVLVGFAGGSGSAMAARERGAPMDAMPVPAPRPGSIEALLSEASGDNERALFVFPTQRDADWLAATRDQRAIGVVYDPDREVYIPTRLGQRYDALIWCKNTTPVQALHFDEARKGTLETLRLS